VDGNKRVAFFATDVFLRSNGWKMTVDPKAAHRHLIALMESGDADFEHLLAWIRAAMKRTRHR
jgi:death-on-curing protein